jgi:hypothetical protein
MQQKLSEADLMAEGRRVLAVLGGVEPKLPTDLNSARLTTILTSFDTTTSSVKSLKSDLAAAVEAKDTAMGELKEFLKRAKAGAKAAFGDDSLEYERLGGKRASERKRKSSKTAVSAT